ncbi:unnamed protein product [Mytilus coruscus]|uniref:Methyltransferase domain-containing protein n=1 Tax=Mytilus coruscus TaxID=42192 RepID=A0A6J8DHS4_MYTCO|nr:unnamed protein product [Mytilus coruscus]
MPNTANRISERTHDMPNTANTGQKRETISKPISLDSTDQQDKSFEALTTDLRQVGGIEYKCPNLKNRGNWYDCNSSPFIVRKPCLVYSFGQEFEKRGSIFMDGRKSNDAVTNGKKKKKMWKVRTLRQIIELLGHEDRHLDILKVDIEAYEWEVLKNILSDNLISRIRQLNIEFHIFQNNADTSNYVELLQIYRSLKEAGFLRYACNLYRFDNTTKILQTECGLTLCQSRLINHRLPIENGKWKRIQRDKRISEQCDLKDLGDEFYYVMKCKFMAIERKKHIVKKSWTLLKKNLTHLITEVRSKVVQVKSDHSTTQTEVEKLRQDHNEVQRGIGHIESQTEVEKLRQDHNELERGIGYIESQLRWKSLDKIITSYREV